MDLISTRHTIGRRALCLLLSFVMVSSMVLPAMGMTIAVVTTESAPQAGELVSDDGLVTIAYGEDAGIPEGASISVAEVTDSERYFAAAEGMLEEGKKAVYSRFFDIDVVSESGESVSLLAPVEVKINIDDAPVENTTGVSVFHFADEAETIEEDGEIPLAAPEMSLKGLRSKSAVLTMGETDEAIPSDETIDPESVGDAANIEEVLVTENTGDTVSFLANGFSVYGVIYTVDFTYEVGGKEFAYSITGGSGIGLSELLPLLGVVTDNPETEEDEVRDFVNDVDSVEFTDPSLVWVGKVEEECTVGQIKDENRLNCEYSAELMEEDIAALNEKTVKSGDWALISLSSFESEEGLSITMKNKEVLFITVTDAIMEAKSNADKGTPFMGRDTKTLDGITINLFDYGPDTLDSHANNMLNSSNTHADEGINANHPLKFYSFGKTPYETTYGAYDGFSSGTVGINHFSGGKPAIQGIVDSTLNEEGYPHIVGYDEEQGSLEYLFDLNDIEGGAKKVYPDVTGLFQRDANGKLSYDSNQNYARYKDNGTFEMSNTFYEEGSKNANDPANYHKFGIGFFPFNDWNYRKDCVHGNETDNGDGTWWCSGHSANPQKNGYYNHHFGMTMDAVFQMTADGKLNGQDMIFDFSGDDDMWVFIDGKLVLDVGGVHNPVGGRINFRTGEVIVDKAVSVGENLPVTVTGNPWNPDIKLDESKVGSSTKTLSSILGENWNEAGSVHRIQVFYLERGGCYSNLKLEMALLTLQKGEIELTKKDGYGAVLKDALFGLYTDSACENPLKVGDEVVTATSDAAGKVKFENVPINPAGQDECIYYMKEIMAPAGYRADGSTYQVTLRSVNHSQDTMVTKLGETAAVTDVRNEKIPVPPVDKAAPDGTKYKTENKNEDGSGNGTYKIHLTVTGNAAEEEKVEKSNVIIIMDESSSMRYGQLTKVGSAANGVPDFTIKENVQYYYPYSSGSQGGVNASPLSNDGGSLIIPGYWGGPYTGDVYTFRNRLDYEQEALGILVDSLLANNKPGETAEDGTRLDDIVEIAVVGFNSSGWIKSNWSTDAGAIKEEIKKDELGNQTHWWDALDLARSLASEKRAQQKDEDIHVIFLTDGRPLEIVFSLIDPTPEQYYNKCVPAVRNLMNLGEYIHLYNIYTYGSLIDQDNDAANPGDTNGRYPEKQRLIDLTGVASSIGDAKYHDAETVGDFQDILSEILEKISKQVAFTRVAITDKMTSNAAAAALVNGKADGFTYQVTGSKNYTVTATGGEDPTVTFHIGGEDYPTDIKKTGPDGKPYYSVTVAGVEYKMALAEFNESTHTVDWDLGGIGILEHGCTYEVNFDIWPNQESYDYLADLNNGIKTWDSSKEEAVLGTNGTVKYYTGGVPGYPDIVRLPGGGYSVLTNEKQTLTYSIAHTVDGETTYDGPYEKDLPMPDPMPLLDRKIRIEKRWEDGLDESQLPDEIEKAGEDGFTAKLVLKRDYQNYIANITVKPVYEDGVLQKVWPEMEGNEKKLHDISLGMMITENENNKVLIDTIKQDTKKYPQVNLEGKTYYILDSGHDFRFEEVDPDSHFELKEAVFHPMLVDGELKEVQFSKTGNKITGIDKILNPVLEGNTVVLEAVNELKGGIQIYKEVYKEDGTTRIMNDSTPFTVTVNLKKADEPYSVSAADGGWRLYYGVNNPNKGDPVTDKDGKTILNYGREDSRHAIENGTFTAELYPGDYIQVSNVDRGVRYEVSENDVPSGYEKIGIDYYIEDELNEADPKVMTSNQSHKVIVKNKKLKPTTKDFSFSKLWYDAAEGNSFDWPADKSIYVTVWQDVEEYASYTITAADLEVGKGISAGVPEKLKLTVVSASGTDGYEFKITGLPYGETEDGFTYTVSEQRVDSYQDPKYFNGETQVMGASRIGDGGMIRNDRIGVELPSTGGPGTAAFIFAGITITLTSGAILTHRSRKKEE